MNLFKWSSWQSLFSNNTHSTDSFSEGIGEGTTVNPANGLSMTPGGLVDVQGNPYGSDLHSSDFLSVGASSLDRIGSDFLSIDTGSAFDTSSSLHNSDMWTDSWSSSSGSSNDY